MLDCSNTPAAQCLASKFQDAFFCPKSSVVMDLGMMVERDMAN